MKKFALQVMLVLICSFGISETSAKIQDKTQEKPRLIAVLPPLIKAENVSLRGYGLIEYIRDKNRAKKSDWNNLTLFIQEQVGFALHDKSYEIYSFKKTNVLVKEQGARVKLNGSFKEKNIDAIVKVTVNRWDDSRLRTQSELVVELEIELVSVKTGKSLWKGRNKARRIHLQKNIVRPDLAAFFNRALRSALKGI